MAINAEKLYDLACANLLTACIAAYDGDEKDGNALFNMVKRNPDAYSSVLPINTAREIFVMAKDELGKAKGGTAYSAVKRFIKGCTDARPSLKGVWMDAEGRQCMCDGYHAIRLKTPVEGFETVTGMDLNAVFPPEWELVQEIRVPTPGEVKINSVMRGSYPKRKCYDFGDGLPMVTVQYLKNIMDCLPDAKAYITDKGETSVIVFKSDKGDAILLPVRKKVA